MYIGVYYCIIMCNLVQKAFSQFNYFYNNFILEQILPATYLLAYQLDAQNVCGTNTFIA